MSAFASVVQAGRVDAHANRLQEHGFFRDYIVAALFRCGAVKIPVTFAAFGSGAPERKKQTFPTFPFRGGAP
jgi:hypothetical protein